MSLPNQEEWWRIKLPIRLDARTKLSDATSVYRRLTTKCASSDQQFKVALTDLVVV